MRRAIPILALFVIAFLSWGYANILAAPVERRASVGLADWPAGARPIRVALLSDVHVQGPDMPPSRVAAIVRTINAAKPDLVLIAGDLDGSRSLGTHRYSEAEIAAPLGRLTAPLGVFAVLGNHDHWRDGAAMRLALEAAGVRVLVNQAVRAGPIVLAGADDAHTGHADIAAVTAAADAMAGPAVLLTHSPDLVPELPPRFPLVLAGHTHCGQVVLPLIGTVQSSSRYGDRYGCGVVREGGRTIIVTAGLGASVVPLRFGATPDWWMVTLGPAATPTPARAAR
jgi:hypothetical protein